MKSFSAGALSAILAAQPLRPALKICRRHIFLTLRPGRTYFSRNERRTDRKGGIGGPCANPVERFEWGEETQGSGWRFRRQAEPEQSELCGDERRAQRDPLSKKCLHFFESLRRPGRLFFCGSLSLGSLYYIEGQESSRKRSWSRLICFW